MAAAPIVVVASGHMVDAPGRTDVRFPEGEVERVTSEVAAALRSWGVGPGSVLVTSGARGADIIAAEQAAALGANVTLCLAMPPGEFERASVALPGTTWADRFHALLEIADVHVLQEEVPDAPAGDAVFERTNAWIVDTARRLAADGHPRAVIVWDGSGGDGKGGTRDFVRRLGFDAPDPDIRVIDPRPRGYEHRQMSFGPKRLLSLDGGGIRGALSLEILGAIEAGLRARYGNPSYVLGDYFDYVGGTSTGAIIAAGIALGLSVQELQEHYRALGTKVFRKRFLPFRTRSFYKSGALTESLEEILGPDRTLGDPGLRSLLLLVLYRTDTDSFWPLSNCTQAKYNRADRYLKQPPDRNLDFSLTTLVRGSTAAPIYFPPQELRADPAKGPIVFQDGGVTPFNNPALLMFLMATLPEYGLEWPTGEDQLLLVSVGTGKAAAVHPDLLAKKVGLLFNARNLPTVFMNGASTAQDLVCRALGRCRFGATIDSEFGARIGAAGVAGRNLFTYLRYDGDLSDNALEAIGVGSKRARKRLRKLDAVGSLPTLEQIGQMVGESVDLNSHFAGFL